MNETDWEGAGRTLGGFWEPLGNISQQFSESPRNSRLLIVILPGANAPRLANVFAGRGTRRRQVAALHDASDILEGSACAIANC